MSRRENNPVSTVSVISVRKEENYILFCAAWSVANLKPLKYVISEKRLLLNVSSPFLFNFEKFFLSVLFSFSTQLLYIRCICVCVCVCMLRAFISWDKSFHLHFLARAFASLLFARLHILYIEYFAGSYWKNRFFEATQPLSLGTRVSCILRRAINAMSDL